MSSWRNSQTCWLWHDDPLHFSLQGLPDFMPPKFIRDALVTAAGSDSPFANQYTRSFVGGTSSWKWMLHLMRWHSSVLFASLIDRYCTCTVCLLLGPSATGECLIWDFLTTSWTQGWSTWWDPDYHGWIWGTFLLCPGTGQPRRWGQITQTIYTLCSLGHSNNCFSFLSPLASQPWPCHPFCSEQCTIVAMVRNCGMWFHQVGTWQPSSSKNKTKQKQKQKTASSHQFCLNSRTRNSSNFFVAFLQLAFLSFDPPPYWEACHLRNIMDKVTSHSRLSLSISGCIFLSLLINFVSLCTWPVCAEELSFRRQESFLLSPSTTILVSDLHSITALLPSWIFQVFSLRPVKAMSWNYPVMQAANYPYCFNILLSIDTLA